jgi:hypothetical protein
MHGIDWPIVFHFYTDASKYGARLCITQFQVIEGKLTEVPILFDPFMFAISRRKYPTYKREFCATIRFCCKCNYMLKDPSPPGIIHTDHKPLVQFLASDLHEGIYGRWAAKMRELSLEIRHIPGHRNKVVYGLSRTLFADQDCAMDEVTRAVQAEVEKQGPQWVWKDGKGGFTDFLNSLTKE